MSKRLSPEVVRILECLARCDTKYAQSVLATAVFTILDGEKRGLSMANIVTHCQFALAAEEQ